MRGDVFAEIEKYTKDEILQALKNTMFRPESLLRQLPLIRYNTMCDNVQKISDEAQKAMKENNFKLANELFDKSNKLFENANKFIDKQK